jgi:hypothetical protein
VKRTLALLLLVGVSACTGKTPTTSTGLVHEFNLVSSGVPAGASSPMDFAPCLKGRHEGKAVLLLSDRDSNTCSVMGGKVGSHVMAGECTFLEGIAPCGQGFPLAVLGSRGAYKRMEPKAVTDELARAALLQAVVKGKVVEAATERWRKALTDVAYEEVIVEALTWPGLDGAPTLVRLRAKGEATEGPWVAIAHGAVGTMVGPFSMEVPTGFMLDGRSYLSIPVAICHHCGGVGTEVHAVEDGRLRRVLESFANAN